MRVLPATRVYADRLAQTADSLPPVRRARLHALPRRPVRRPDHQADAPAPLRLHLRGHRVLRLPPDPQAQAVQGRLPRTARTPSRSTTRPARPSSRRRGSRSGSTRTCSASSERHTSDEPRARPRRRRDLARKRFRYARTGDLMHLSSVCVARIRDRGSMMGDVTRRGSAAQGARADSRSAADLVGVRALALAAHRLDRCRSIDEVAHVATIHRPRGARRPARRVLPHRPGHVPRPSSSSRRPPPRARSGWSRASYRADDRPALRALIRDRASWVAHARTVHDEPTVPDDPDAGDPVEVDTLRELDAATALGVAAGGQRQRLGPARTPSAAARVRRSGSTTSPAPRCSPRSSPAPSRASTSRRRCVTSSPTTR